MIWQINNYIELILSTVYFKFAVINENIRLSN